MRTITTRSSLPVWTAAMALLAVVGTVSGQNALGDGTGLANPLDAYERQLNSESRTDQFRRESLFREAVVTGRAAGGLSFRGDAGYGSALEFRGELGSDVTYAYRRDAAISGLAAQGVSGTDALRLQFALSTGSSLPPGYTGAGIVQRDPSRIVLPASAFPVLQPSSTELMRPKTLGERSYEELAAAGETLRAEARDMRSVSSLVGLSSLNPSTVQTVDLGLGRQSFDVVASPTAGVRMRPIESPLVLGGIKPDSTALKSAETSPGMLSAINRQIVRRPSDPLRPDLDPTQPADPAVDPMADPTADPSTDPARDPAFDPTNPQPVVDPVTGQPVTQPADPTLDPSQPEEPQDSLLTPTRLDAIRHLLSSEDPESDVDGPMLTENELRLMLGAPVVTELVERRDGLEYDAAYVLHMARGQSLLTEGRYFDAEERFVTALSIRPNDPTAMIGRVHAELGAGLLRSASTNLREAIAAHPEIVAVRYAEELLPTESRFEAIIKELGFAKDLPASSIGLLRAYIAYQRDNRDLILQGLDQLRSGNRSDMAMARLLSEVWLAEEDQ